MSSILPVASKTEKGEEEKDQVRDGQIVDGEVAHLGEVGHHVGVGEHGEDPRGDVEAVVVVAPDADDERPNDEKFVQGIGRRQSTAMSRTGESSPLLLCPPVGGFLLSVNLRLSYKVFSKAGNASRPLLSLENLSPISNFSDLSPTFHRSWASNCHDSNV